MLFKWWITLYIFHWINHYPADRVVCFVNTYPLDSIIYPLNNWGRATILLTGVKHIFTSMLCLTYTSTELMWHVAITVTRRTLQRQALSEYWTLMWLSLIDLYKLWVVQCTCTCLTTWIPSSVVPHRRKLYWLFLFSPRPPPKTWGHPEDTLSSRHKWVKQHNYCQKLLYHFTDHRRPRKMERTIVHLLQH